MQNDQMALNKSKNSWHGLKWLSIHVAVYTAFMSLSSSFTNYALLQVFLAHWVTDFFTSRAISKLWFMTPHNLDSCALENPVWTFKPGSWRHWFFVMIGLDQVIHYTCLTLTLALVK